MRNSVQPGTSFLRASVLPPTADTLPSVQQPTFVRYFTFLYWLLSLLYFSQFAVSYFSYFAVTLFFFINSCGFSYSFSFFLPDEASVRNVVNSTVCCSTVRWSLIYYTSILFVGHKCRNFFCVAHFRAAILDFSARFGAASCWCNFAFCSTTYVRPLFHLPLLAFVTFILFHSSLTSIIHTSLSPYFLHKFMRFLILSFISLT